MKTSMKILSTLIVAFASVQHAFAANYHDVCTLGYCTFNGGTSGGSGGVITPVSTLAGLRAAVGDDARKIVVITGIIIGNEAVLIGSNKSILGATGGATLVGVCLKVIEKSNVIIRNLRIQKCLAPLDGIGIQSSTNVWVDHVELSADMDHDIDYYDGLLDITHAADYITISNVNFHDNWKGSLIGNSDSNSAEDTGHLKVTYYQCHFNNINSRCPTVRFGTVHIINGWYQNMGSPVVARVDSVVRIDNSVFEDNFAYICGQNGGKIYIDGTVCGVPVPIVPYVYSPTSVASVPFNVAANEGPILVWE